MEYGIFQIIIIIKYQLNVRCALKGSIFKNYVINIRQMCARNNPQWRDWHIEQVENDCSKSVNWEDCEFWILGGLTLFGRQVHGTSNTRPQHSGTLFLAFFRSYRHPRPKFWKMAFFWPLGLLDGPRKNFFCHKLFSSHQDKTFLWQKLPCQTHQ